MTNFGERLKELRIERKMRQKDLANKLGIAQTTIANYEQNIRFPNEKILVQIADFFNVSLDYLFNRRYNTIINKFESSEIHYDILNNNEYLLCLRNQYINAVLEFDKKKAYLIINRALTTGFTIESIYLEILGYSLVHIDALFEIGKVNIAQTHYSFVIAQFIMSQLYTLIKVNSKKSKSAVTMPVGGDQHTIGIRMVTDLLEANGWDTYYLGTSIPSNCLVNLLSEKKINILVVSSTIPYYYNSVKDLIDFVHSNKGCKNVKIIVGGMTFDLDKELWKKVGADGYAETPKEAVVLANSLFD